MSAVGWNPIETAPKDGTEVDLWFPYAKGGYRVTDAKWMEMDFGRSSGPFYAWRHEWNPEFEREPLSGEPTHWMPPPEPPQ